MKRLILILLCIANLLTITYFSAQNAKKSTEVSEGITVKVVSTVIGKSETDVKDNIKQYDKYTRNFAHFFLFMTLGVLLYLTFKEFSIKLSFLYALAICLVYALFDEMYQEFSSQGRAFEIVDLLKDWSGSLVGIVTAYLFKSGIRKCWEEKA